MSLAPSEPAMPMLIVMLSLPGARLIAIGRRLDALAQAFGDREGKRHIGVGHDDDEFLAAIAAGQIDAADIGGDAVGEFLEHFVADVVAVAVIDRLEVVDVENEEGERLARAAGRLDSRLSRWRDM